MGYFFCVPAPTFKLGSHTKTILQRKDGSIRKIDRTNLTYVEPHRIIINDITFLDFNYSNYSGLDLKYFKQQYDPEVKSRFKGLNLFNKKEIEKATKHINDEMDEYAEDFYNDKKDKEKDECFEL